MTYFFTGLPLSGKSTAARRLAREEGLRYFSTGDYARSLGMGQEPSIRSRDLSERFDSDISKRVLEEVAAGGAVIDGFPRSMDQLSLIKDGPVMAEPFTIVFVTANPLVIFDRMSDRAASEGRPEDVRDVVAGRLAAADKWRRELQGAFPGLVLVRAEDLMEASRVLDALAAGGSR